MGIESGLITYGLGGVIAAIFLFKSYKKGHSIQYLMMQTVFSVITYWIADYFFVPIIIEADAIEAFTFSQQFNSISFEKIWSYLNENIYIMGMFTTFAFFYGLLFKKAEKISFCSISIVGMVVIHMSYHVLTNYIHGGIGEIIVLTDYLLIIPGFYLGIGIFKILVHLNYDYISNLRKINRRKKQSDYFEMDEL